MRFCVSVISLTHSLIHDRALEMKLIISNVERICDGEGEELPKLNWSTSLVIPVSTMLGRVVLFVICTHSAIRR